MRRSARALSRWRRIRSCSCAAPIGRGCDATTDPDGVASGGYIARSLVTWLFWPISPSDNVCACRCGSTRLVQASCLRSARIAGVVDLMDARTWALCRRLVDDAAVYNYPRRQNLHCSQGSPICVPYVGHRSRGEGSGHSGANDDGSGSVVRIMDFGMKAFRRSTASRTDKMVGCCWVVLGSELKHRSEDAIGGG